MNASDDFLAEKLSEIPESDDRKFDEKSFSLKLANYRIQEKSGELIGFFEEAERFIEVLGNAFYIPKFISQT